MGTINNNGIINNSGLIRTVSTIFESSFINNYGILNNSGIFDSSNGIFNNQGILKGTGTFIGNFINDSGTVAPGNSAGTMMIDDDFTLDDLGILEIEIGGFSPGLFDHLDITGIADLSGGEIEFLFLPGYDITADIGAGETWQYTFLTAGDITNFNSLINYNFTMPPEFLFNVYQQGNDLIFEATNIVPIPSTILLSTIGLAVAGLKLRKRREL